MSADFYAWMQNYIDKNQAVHGVGVCWEYLNGKRHMCFSDMCGTYSHPTLRVSKSGDNGCRVRFSRAVKSWRNAIKAIGGFYFDDRTQSWINSSMTTSQTEQALIASKIPRYCMRVEVSKNSGSCSVVNKNSGGGSSSSSSSTPEKKPKRKREESNNDETRKNAKHQRLLGFGKHKDKTYEYVRQNDIGYCNWVIMQQNPSKGDFENFQNYLKEE